jgi:glycosyltransferase involved in cell wall biosynthesis
VNGRSPLFSVVIPTRNRANLLPYALQSALHQEFDDYEIVVSDNCSSDNTEQVVRHLATGKVRYVRTPRSFDMADSWEFALRQTRGEYVTYLCDDDAIHPALLAKAARVIEQEEVDIVAWPFGGIYYHGNWHDEHERNVLRFAKPPRQTRIIESQSVLDELSNCRFTHKLPRFLNSCASRTLIAEISGKVGRVFWPSCPDYTSGVAQLAFRGRLAYLDDLLLLWGVAKESIGASACNQGEAAKAFVEELSNNNVPILEHVPVKILSPMNYGLDSFLFIYKKLAEKLPELQFDWSAYYRVIGSDVFGRKSSDRNGNKEIDKFWRALSQEHWSRRCRVCADLVYRDLRKRVNLGRFRKVIAGGPPPLGTARGEEYGFRDIFECSQALDAISGVAQRQNTKN